MDLHNKMDTMRCFCGKECVNPLTCKEHECPECVQYYANEDLLHRTGKLLHVAPIFIREDVCFYGADLVVKDCHSKRAVGHKPCEGRFAATKDSKEECPTCKEFSKCGLCNGVPILKDIRACSKCVVYAPCALIGCSNLRTQFITQSVSRRLCNSCIGNGVHLCIGCDNGFERNDLRSFLCQTYRWDRCTRCNVFTYGDNNKAGLLVEWRLQIAPFMEYALEKYANGDLTLLAHVYRTTIEGHRMAYLSLFRNVDTRKWPKLLETEAPSLLTTLVLLSRVPKDVFRLILMQF